MPVRHRVTARRERLGHALKARDRSGTPPATPEPAPSPTPTPVPTPEPAPTLAAPGTALASAPTAYPPRVTVDLTAGARVGDRLRLRVAEDFGFTTVRLSEAIVLTGDPAADGSALNGLLASIGSGTGYIDVRAERDAAVGFRSVPLLYGTNAVPAITSGLAFTSVETRPLLELVELAGPGFLLLGGQDADRFELVDAAQPGTRFRLCYLGNATKDHDAPDDRDRDGVYELDLVVRGLNGVEAIWAATVTLLDLDTVPDDFELPALRGVPRSTMHAAPVVTVGGLAAGYAAPVSASHPYVKNGAAPASARGTVVNGDRLTFPPVLSAAEYSTAVERSLTVGPITRTFFVTTEAAPASAAWVASSTVPAFLQVGFAAAVASFPAVDFTAGLGVVAVAPQGAGRQATGVSIGGVAATRRLVTTAGDDASVWTAPVAAAGEKEVVVTYNFPPSEVGIITGTVARAGSEAPAGTALLNAGHRFDPPHRTETALVVPTGGVGVLFAFTGENAVFSYTPGLTATSAGARAGTAMATTSLTPGLQAPNGFVALLALSWGAAA